MKTYVISEAATTWLHGGLDEARHSIEEAARCGASAWKTQWCSDAVLMHSRRGIQGTLYGRLSWQEDWHPRLSEYCRASGIEYLCTVFIPSDVERVVAFVDKGKIAAYEHSATDLIQAWVNTGKPVIQSLNYGVKYEARPGFSYLCCVSLYPTSAKDLHLHRLREGYSGLSDHTQSTLTGAVSVSVGATIIEKHCMTHSTPHDDPDYGHSLILDSDNPAFSFKKYVDNIREAEELIG